MQINRKNKMSIKRYIPVILLSLSSIAFAANSPKFSELCSRGKELVLDYDNWADKTKNLKIIRCGDDNNVTVEIKGWTRFYCVPVYNREYIHYVTSIGIMDEDKFLSYFLAEFVWDDHFDKVVRYNGQGKRHDTYSDYKNADISQHCSASDADDWGTKELTLKVID